MNRFKRATISLPMRESVPFFRIGIAVANDQIPEDVLAAIGNWVDVVDGRMEVAIGIATSRPFDDPARVIHDNFRIAKELFPKLKNFAFAHMFTSFHANPMPLTEGEQ